MEEAQLYFDEDDLWEWIDEWDDEVHIFIDPESIEE